MDAFEYRTHGIIPDPLLGQNFLIDRSVMEQEIELLSLSRDDSVLEIGPGMGWVTEMILPRCGSMTVVEKDRRFEPRLAGLGAAHPNLRIVWADAMTADLPPFTKAISNLPFRIALPLTFRILEKDFSAAALVYQKRLADRICASSGQDHFCRLSVQIRRLAEARLIRIIPPAAFRPKPAVDCALVLLKKRVLFDVADTAYFKRVLDHLFFRRDLSCREALADLFRGREGDLDSCVSELGPNAAAAVQTLDVMDFGAIVRALYERAVDVAEIPNDLKRKSQKILKEEAGHEGRRGHALSDDSRHERDRKGRRAPTRRSGDGPRPRGRKRR